LGVERYRRAKKKAVLTAKNRAGFGIWFWLEANFPGERRERSEARKEKIANSVSERGNNGAVVEELCGRVFLRLNEGRGRGGEYVW